MDKNILKRLVDKGLSTRKIAKECNYSQCNVRYWLKKYNLKTNPTLKSCNVCKVCKKEFKDYQGKKRARCGPCNTKIRRYRTKEAAIKYLGGKCKKCKWVGNQSAFEFHHLDPSKKDFTIGAVSNKSWESIIKEIDKCELLCANCHKIIHSTRDDKRFLEEAKNYGSRS